MPLGAKSLRYYYITIGQPSGFCDESAPCSIPPQRGRLLDGSHGIGWDIAEKPVIRHPALTAPARKSVLFPSLHTLIHALGSTIPGYSDTEPRAVADKHGLLPCAVWPSIDQLPLCPANSDSPHCRPTRTLFNLLIQGLASKMKGRIRSHLDCQAHQTRSADGPAPLMFRLYRCAACNRISRLSDSFAINPHPIHFAGDRGLH